ncbi:unnamed protein product, partial [Prorocentrum cordatum]
MLNRVAVELVAPELRRAIVETFALQFIMGHVGREVFHVVVDVFTQVRGARYVLPFLLFFPLVPNPVAAEHGVIEGLTLKHFFVMLAARLFDQMAAEAVKVASINVTSLTRATAEAIFRHPQLESVTVMAWSGLRLAVQRPPWLIKLAAQFGWGVACSDPPPTDVRGSTTQGGTAILWRRSAGKITVYRSSSLGHRAVAIRTANAAYVSGYGPAQGDAAWLVRAMGWTQDLADTSVLFGDLNWKPGYCREACAGWQAATPCGPTTTAGSTPSRLLVWGGDPEHEPSHLSNTFVEGIPYHSLSIFTLTVEEQHRQLYRLHHTAEYQAHKLSFITDAEIEAIMESCDQVTPKPMATEPFVNRWRAWHARAEHALKEATTKKWTACSRKPEREKGSMPTCRPTAAPPPHRLEETVALRRARRLHRSFNEQIRHHFKGNVLLNDKHLSKFAQACMDGVVTAPPGGIPTYHRALDSLSAAITAEQQKISNSKVRSWATVFAKWSSDVYNYATPRFRAPAPAAGFDAAAMRDEWKQHWDPPNYDLEPLTARWLERAEGAEFPQSAFEEQWLPSEEEFIHSLKKAKGAAGFDGWTSKEVKLLLQIAPPIITELYCLWCHTSIYAVQHAGRAPRDLALLVFPWRVVGIPKKDEHESRPIGVASVLLRSWLSALALALPEVAANQWACRRRTSVVHAVSHWLSEACTAGLEMDLTKAYDNIAHRIAEEAFRKEAVPETVIMTCRLAWAGPRVCCVSDELSEAIWPTK